jgi:hypothetical protein
MLRISFNKPLPLNAMMISRKRSYGGGDDGRDLEDAGFIFAGDLKGLKARLLLMAALVNLERGQPCGLRSARSPAHVKARLQPTPPASNPHSRQ